MSTNTHLGPALRSKMPIKPGRTPHALRSSSLAHSKETDVSHPHADQPRRKPKPCCLPDQAFLTVSALSVSSMDWKPIVWETIGNADGPIRSVIGIHTNILLRQNGPGLEGALVKLYCKHLLVVRAWLSLGFLLGKQKEPG
jgi:hypothetical protein